MCCFGEESSNHLARTGNRTRYPWILTPRPQPLAHPSSIKAPCKDSLCFKNKGLWRPCPQGHFPHQKERILGVSVPKIGVLHCFGEESSNRLAHTGNRTRYPWTLSDFGRFDPLWSGGGGAKRGFQSPRGGQQEGTRPKPYLTRLMTPRGRRILNYSYIW